MDNDFTKAEIVSAIADYTCPQVCHHEIWKTWDSMDLPLNAWQN